MIGVGAVRQRFITGAIAGAALCAALAGWAMARLLIRLATRPGHSISTRSKAVQLAAAMYVTAAGCIIMSVSHVLRWIEGVQFGGESGQRSMAGAIHDPGEGQSHPRSTCVGHDIEHFRYGVAAMQPVWAPVSALQPAPEVPSMPRSRSLRVRRRQAGEVDHLRVVSNGSGAGEWQLERGPDPSQGRVRDGPSTWPPEGGPAQPLRVRAHHRGGASPGEVPRRG
jgi:hypothetical protein